MAESSAKEKLGECIYQKDFECASTVLELQNMITKKRVEGLLEHGWLIEAKDQLEKHLQWLKSHQPNT